ncbi:MAG: thioredoxin family protein [Limisphaerales bacterium]
MKIALLAAIASFALSFSCQAAATWRTDFESAKTEAKRDGRIIVMNFTGSDWCGFCIKMKKDSLEMKAFTDYAAKNAVLLEVDFPSRKKLPAAQVKANEALRKRYNVEGYPTFVFTDATGKELGRHVGYLQGGPLAFIDRMEKAKAKSGATASAK